MTTQINLKFQDDFFELAKDYADARGYMSVQELVRDALREKIFENLEVREEYKKVLDSKEANKFNSVENSKRFIDELRKKTSLN